MEQKDLTEAIGDCGRFHVFITVATHAGTVSLAMGMMMMTFGMYNPGWTCQDSAPGPGNSTLSANYSTDLHHSLSASPSPDIHGDHGNESLRNFDCAALSNCQNWTYKEGSSTLITEWNLVCDLAWVPPVIISIQMVGVLIGASVSGHISDQFGRKKGFYGSVVFHGLAHVLAIFSISWQMCAVIYFFIGVGVGGVLSCAYPYSLEFINGWWRGIYAGIPFWPISFFIFAVDVYILRDWRNIHISVCVLSLLILLSALWIPESVRWLAVSGKVSKSKKVVARIARINKRSTPDTSAIDEIARKGKMKMGWPSYTYVDLIRIPSLRPLTIKVGIIWFICAYVYYAITFGISALSGDFYINLLIAAGLEFPGIVILPPIINKLGRRNCAALYTVFEITCSLSLVIVTFVTSEEQKEKSILCLALLCRIMHSGTWGVLIIYCSELYPTVVRTLQFGFFNSIARVGAILSPYLVPSDSNDLYLCFTVIGVISVGRLCILLSLPETKRCTLRDIVHDSGKERRPIGNEEEEE